MKKIFLIDNYDSFTYNLLFYLEELGCDVTVKRNDLFEVEDIKNFDAILISPGPGIPSESGKTLEVLKYYCESKNILGVCLGQQAIAEAFGGKLRNLERVYHGVATKNNIVLIFDECTSGFRQSFGGIHKIYGVEPDMAIFGKALGNGYAITSVIGRREVMENAQSTFISSTF